jgi:hypothetical protein
MRPGTFKALTVAGWLQEKPDSSGKKMKITFSPEDELNKQSFYKN